MLCSWACRWPPTSVVGKFEQAFEGSFRPRVNCDFLLFPPVFARWSFNLPLPAQLAFLRNVVFGLLEFVIAFVLWRAVLGRRLVCTINFIVPSRYILYFPFLVTRIWDIYLLEYSFFPTRCLNPWLICLCLRLFSLFPWDEEGITGFCVL